MKKWKKTGSWKKDMSVFGSINPKTLFPYMDICIEYDFIPGKEYCIRS